MRIGMTLVTQTGLTGLVGRILWPLTQLSRLNSRRFESSPASVSTSSTYQAATRKCYSARLCFPSPGMANILLGKQFLNRAWPRERHWVTGRFGLRLISMETSADTWRVTFFTMAGGFWLAKWNSNRVRCCLVLLYLWVHSHSFIRGIFLMASPSFLYFSLFISHFLLLVNFLAVTILLRRLMRFLYRFSSVEISPNDIPDKRHNVVTPTTANSSIYVVNTTNGIVVEGKR